jgi:hypothetical protein
MSIFRVGSSSTYVYTPIPRCVLSLSSVSLSTQENLYRQTLIESDMLLTSCLSFLTRDEYAHTHTYTHTHLHLLSSLQSHTLIHEITPPSSPSPGTPPTTQPPKGLIRNKTQRQATPRKRRTDEARETDNQPDYDNANGGPCNAATAIRTPPFQPDRPRTDGRW